MKGCAFYRDATPFQKTAIWTFLITFFLIFVGGLVRATGAGLGCPDWPRCFGVWIPPLTADALPEGYDKADFNVLKTWTEYVNRLVGVTVGLFILATFVRAIPLRRNDPWVFYGATAALALVLYQGWLGGQLVRSGLEGWMISVHMVVAILILNVLLFTVHQSMRDRLRSHLAPAVRRTVTVLLGVLMVATIVQVVLGAQVREALSEITAAYPALPRADWIDQVGTLDTVHRSFSWVILGLTLAVYRHARRQSESLYELSKALNTTVLLQIALGAALVYGGLPPALQIFHLVLAAAMTSLQFLMLLFVRNAQSVEENQNDLGENNAGLSGHGGPDGPHGPDGHKGKWSVCAPLTRKNIRNPPFGPSGPYGLRSRTGHSMQKSHTDRFLCLLFPLFC